MEAGDTHVPPPVWGDYSYAAGCGLPIVGEAVGPRVVAASWKDDLEARFALVNRVEEAGPINPHPRAAGPSKTRFLQFTVRIHSIYKFNCYNSHVPLTVETIIYFAVFRCSRKPYMKFIL